MFLKCAVCGKGIPEQVHVEESDRNGNFVLELLDEDLFERFPPLSVQEFVKHVGKR